MYTYIYAYFFIRMLPAICALKPRPHRIGQNGIVPTVTMGVLRVKPSIWELWELTFKSLGFREV